MSVEELTFEEAFKELEETVRRLEAGELTLEDSLALFERGQQLARYCGEKLDAAELKVRQLLPAEEGDSEYKVIPFEEEERD